MLNEGILDSSLEEGGGGAYPTINIMIQKKPQCLCLLAPYNQVDVLIKYKY